MQVLKGSVQHIDICLSIAEELPQYFNTQGIAAMSGDMQKHRLYIAIDSSGVAGFATLQAKNSQVAEISWMAVTPDRQRHGVGTLLIEQIILDLRDEGVKLLEVKTLASAVDYAPYQLTRRFYEARGFVLLETIDPFPGWEPGNPCAIYVKVV
jgi:GNAT superfamily N-acetyltransferase